VLLGNLLVAARDQRGQLVEDAERALLALESFDRVPLENEVEGRGVFGFGGHRNAGRLERKRRTRPATRRSAGAGSRCKYTSSEASSGREASSDTSKSKARHLPGR